MDFKSFWLILLNKVQKQLGGFMIWVNHINATDYFSKNIQGNIGLQAIAMGSGNNREKLGQVFGGSGEDFISVFDYFSRSFKITGILINRINKDIRVYE